MYGLASRSPQAVPELCFTLKRLDTVIPARKSMASAGLVTSSPLGGFQVLPSTLSNSTKELASKNVYSMEVVSIVTENIFTESNWLKLAKQLCTFSVYLFCWSGDDLPQFSLGFLEISSGGLLAFARSIFK